MGKAIIFLNKMSLADSMTEQELKEFLSLYKIIYGKDVKIDINGNDIAIAPNGDIDVTGIVVGRKLKELTDLVVQVCLTVLLTEYEDVYGVGSLRLEDLLGLYNSVKQEEYIQLMKAVMIEKVTRLELIESVTKIDSEINDDTIYFNLELKTVTGESLRNIIINLGAT